MNAHRTHPFHVRIGHWINAVTLLVLVWSGFAMFANDKHFAAIVHALPDSLWSAFQMTGNGAAGRAWHLAFAIVMIANAAWYGFAALRTRTIRRILPQGRNWLRDAMASGIEEIRSPRAAMQTEGYAAAQRVAYTGVFVLVSIMILTGISLWYKRQIPWLIALLGGQKIVLPAHVVIASLLLLFLIVHVVQVLRTGFPALAAMIVGTSDGSPRQRRRALVRAAASLAAVAVAFVAARTTSGPRGVPSYLAWTAEHGGGSRHGLRAERFANSEGGPDAPAAVDSAARR